MELTKNRLYNEIMKEVDILTSQSFDTKEMMYRLSGIAGTLQKTINNKYKTTL